MAPSARHWPLAAFLLTDLAQGRLGAFYTRGVPPRHGNHSHEQHGGHSHTQHGSGGLPDVHHVHQSPAGANDTAGNTSECGVDFDLVAGTEVSNNLGGKGPRTEDAESMHFRNIGTDMAGRSLDVIITADPTYENKVQKLNGFHGAIGTINFAPSRKGSTLEIEFSYTDTGLPATLSHFGWMFLDIDQSNTVREVLTVEGYDSYDVVDGHEFDIEEGDNNVTFSSSMYGAKCDNPKNGQHLKVVTCDDRTVDQAKRAVTLYFKETSGFKVTFKTPYSTRIVPDQGRNVMFTSYEKEECIESVGTRKPGTHIHTDSNESDDDDYSDDDDDAGGDTTSTAAATSNTTTTTTTATTTTTTTTSTGDIAEAAAEAEGFIFYPDYWPISVSGQPLPPAQLPPCVYTDPCGQRLA